MKRFLLALLLLVINCSLLSAEKLVKWTEGSVGLEEVSHYIVLRDSVPIAIVPSLKSYFIDWSGTKDNTYSVRVVFLDTKPDENVPNSTFNIVEGSGVNLVWTDNSDNEDGFTVERSDGQSFVQIAQTGVDISAYTDFTVTEGKQYTYRVNAFNGFGESGYSNKLLTFVLINRPENVKLISR